MPTTNIAATKGAYTTVFKMDGNSLRLLGVEASLEAPVLAVEVYQALGIVSQDAEAKLEMIVQELKNDGCVVEVMHIA